MRTSVFCRVVVIVAIAPVMAACGMSFFAVPQSKSKVQAPDPMPDTVQLIRDNLSAVFPSTTKVDHVLVAPPRHDLHGLGWTACVKANVTGMSGTPIGIETFVVSIEGGKIGDRRRAEPQNRCEAESYSAI
jgi:hypothetical protein